MTAKALLQRLGQTVFILWVVTTLLFFLFRMMPGSPLAAYIDPTMTEDQQNLAGAAQITSIPTLMAFRDGVLVFSQAGALPAAGLEKLIAAVRDLDMDQVRSEIAAQQTS